ncbi:type II toxin-antitoxin system RelE/ParE family toxin [Candidatus Omnitrophota bacterium]
MSKYKINIPARPKKQIENLPEKLRSKIIKVILEVLANNPYIGKPLKADLKSRYSYRVADYRIIYSILKHKLIIHIIKVMHRREAYR